MSRKFRNKISNLVYECTDLILCGKDFQSREPWALNEKRPISVRHTGTISSLLSVLSEDLLVFFENRSRK